MKSLPSAAKVSNSEIAAETGLAKAAERAAISLKAAIGLDRSALDNLARLTLSPEFLRAAGPWPQRAERFRASFKAPKFPVPRALPKLFLDRQNWVNLQRRMIAFHEKHDVDGMMRKFKHARAYPRQKNARPWLALERLTLAEAVDIAPYLPAPQVRRGRPRGSGVVAREMPTLMAEMDRLVGAGMKPTPAARMIAEKQGLKVGVRDQADYIVKRYRTYRESGEK